jgi:hypothetical protein
MASHVVADLNLDQEMGFGGAIFHSLLTTYFISFFGPFFLVEM